MCTGFDDFFEVGNVIEIRAAQVAALLAVGAHVRHRVERHCGDGPVFLYADLVALLRCPAAMHADVVVLAGEFELDRLTGGPGEDHRHVVVVLRLVFVAETAAHVFANHSHFA